jgi:predicted DNA-binding transcriptional regulator YafY
MSKKEYLLRYLMIIKKLRRSKEATFKEINDSLKEASHEFGYDLTISNRTFHRDINEIRLLFNIDIEYNFSEGVYFIDEENRGEIGGRILESFDMINMLNEKFDVTKYVSFESNRSSGTKHFYGLIQAIKNKNVISMNYHIFWLENPTNIDVEPYKLKEFQSKWYLIAKDLEEQKIKTYNLEKIIEFKALNITFEFDEKLLKDENIEYWFKIGKQLIKDDEVEQVCLSFKPEMGKFINTYPLDSSQVILEANEYEYEFLYNLNITDEFVREILSFGDKVKVTVPNYLKDLIVETSKKVLEQYSSS